MIYLREKKLQGHLRSISVEHRLQKSHGIEDDGCVFSVAKNTKRMGLLMLSKRKNFLTPRLVWHQIAWEISLWRTRQRSMFFWFWVLPEAKGWKVHHLAFLPWPRWWMMSTGPHTPMGMLMFYIIPSMLLVAALFLLSRNHQKMRESCIVIRITVNPLF